MLKAADILTIDEARLQLRVDDTSAAVTDIIEKAMDDAIAHVSVQIGASLIDQQRTIIASVPLKLSDPIHMAQPDILIIDRLQAWTTSAKIRMPPDLSWGSETDDLDLDELGRLSGQKLYPPLAGWPDFLSGSHLLVTVTFGFTPPGYVRPSGADPGQAANWSLSGVRRAVILSMRDFYEFSDKPLAGAFITPSAGGERGVL